MIRQLKTLSTVKEKDMTEKGLKIICLSDEGANKNLMIYETPNDMIAVDCGVAFPDDSQFGIDLVLPDISYLVEKKYKLRAFLITHGHDDHFAALPFYMDQFKDVPVYASGIVTAFVRLIMDDVKGEGFMDELDFRLLTAGDKNITFGDFKLDVFSINHSVPDSLGFALHTPEGLIVHIADYKVDMTPVLDKPFDLAALEGYAKEGILCLVSDCLGADLPGKVPSESSLNETFPEIFKQFVGRQIFITTISSNISRMRQIIDAAIAANRKVVLLGRSIINKGGVCRKLGYLPDDDTLYIDRKNASKYAQDSLVYIVGGCFGQVGSSLDRIAKNELRDTQADDNAVIVFSAEPAPPGTDVAVQNILHSFAMRDLTLLYPSMGLHLHVSGHGHHDDLKQIAQLAKPKYFIPIGGMAHKEQAFRNMTMELGYKKDATLDMHEGESLIFMNGVAKKGETIPVKEIYVENRAISANGNIVVQDRQALSTDGIFIVILPVSRKGELYADKIEVVTRGVVYVKESQDLLNQAKNIIKKTIGKNVQKNNLGTIKKKIEQDMERFFYNKSKVNPVIIVHTITI